MLKIWVGQTTLNGEKKEDGPNVDKREEVSKAGQVRVEYDARVLSGSYRY